MKTVFAIGSPCFLNIQRTKTTKHPKLVFSFLLFKNMFLKIVFRTQSEKIAPKQIFLFLKNNNTKKQFYKTVSNRPINFLKH